MHQVRNYRLGIIRAALLIGLLLAGSSSVLAQPSRGPAKVANSGVSTAGTGDVGTLGDTRAQLIKLLRMTPALTGAVAHDPSLLADQQYVTRSNPELAQFLEAHPEVARNPEFYLFANVGDRNRVRGLQREVWPELAPEYRSSVWLDFSRGAAIALVFAVVIGGLVWVIRLFTDNSRWNRAFKLQTEMQSRLLDKFATNQELIAYLETDAGKRIMQLPAIPVREPGPRWGGILSRVLASLRLGAVLIVLGIGLEILRHSFPSEGELVVLGALALTLGIGLVIAGIISWAIARHYGLLTPSFPATRAESGIGRNLQERQ